MKTIKIIIFFLAIMPFTNDVRAQASAKEVKTISFQVSGVCGMCEERIENALDVSGVKKADYNVDTHQVEVIYRTDKISEDELHALLNEAGHDTEKSKATDEQYDNVHACCKYREHKDH